MCMLNEAEITKLGPKEDVPIITFWTAGGTPCTTQCDIKHFGFGQSHFLSNKIVCFEQLHQMEVADVFLSPPALLLGPGRG